MTPFPKLCRDCKWSEPEKNSAWNLRCTSPVVNADDEWALSATEIRGTSCSTERGRGMFAPCGKRGRRWESLRDALPEALPQNTDATTERTETL